MPLRYFAPLLALGLMACPRTPVPELQASARAQINAYVETWGSGATLEDLECDVMAGGIPDVEYCTSVLEGERVVWRVTITPVEGARTDSVAIEPDGAVFTDRLELHAINHLLRLEVTPPTGPPPSSVDCGEATVIRRTVPSDTVECAVLEGGERRALRAILTDSLDTPRFDLEARTP